jgi:hypothetical protein
MSYAPIALFTYNRLEHTRKTLTALANNELASKTSITIYSDAPRSDLDKAAVQDVRAYLDSVTGFQSIRVVKQDKNLGLAKSIISGVTQCVNESGRIIVMEDDMLTSPHFLNYMNQALDEYTHEKRVMHVAGWGYPIAKEGLDDGYLWRGMNCWGWGTWADRWAYFKKDIDEIYRQIPLRKRRQFNLNGRRRYWAEVAANRSGVFDTWAVFWYATIFLRSGLCANPTESLVQNIGLDGSGVNCAEGALEHLAGELSQKSEFKLQSTIKENSEALSRILNFYDRTRRPFLLRLLGRLKNVIR